jgi:ethanolamine utilization protein EutA
VSPTAEDRPPTTGGSPPVVGGQSSVVDAASIHFPDHHAEGAGDPRDAEAVAEALWRLDNVELTTVGVDIGSSTSHLLFARLHLQRLTQSLSSRFAVARREVLHRSPILLTPYRQDGRIDIDALERFVDDAYRQARLSPEEVDTGAVILTGVALERANSRAVGDLFARHGGKFVCASAGHNLEAILAAHGSGAVTLSRQRGDALLHIDLGGGTSKISLVRNGEVLETAAVSVGGRLVAFDADQRIERIERAGRTVAGQLGIQLELAGALSLADRRRLAGAMAEMILEVASGPPASQLAQQLLLTEPLSPADSDQRPSTLTFSGGVSEYIYGRETASFGDLAPELADALLSARERHSMPAELLSLGEGIRATAIGASQFTVQLSGNTVHISNPARLPLRNLPVVHPRIPCPPLDERTVEAAVKGAFRRLDLREGDQPAALAFSWRGEPDYRALRALAGGIARALPRSIQTDFPLVVALQEDVGRSLGGILTEELGVTADLVAIDGLRLAELDYVDIGEIIQPANVVPVVIKSLAFPEPSETPQ